MKIFFVAPQYDYGDPSRGFSFEYENFYANVLEMSHEVFPYDPHERIKAVGRDRMNDELRGLVEKRKPDLLFVCLTGDELKKEMVEDVSKKTSTVTYNWFFDDQWRFDNFSRLWAPAFDWVSTTDPHAVPKYRRLGYRNVIKTQYGYNNFVYENLSLPKIYDVTFIGQLHGTRRRILEWLRSQGVEVKTFGYGTEGGRLSQEDMVRVINQSKINLCFMNLSRDPNWKGLLKIFLKKERDRFSFDLAHIPSNVKFFLAKQRLQVKARNFEIPAAGGFMITNDLAELADFFDMGSEIVTFKTRRDLLKKVRYYLENDVEREKIALRGYERALRDHSYEKRFMDIFNFIFAGDPKRRL